LSTGVVHFTLLLLVISAYCRVDRVMGPLMLLGPKSCGPAVVTGS